MVLPPFDFFGLLAGNRGILGTIPAVHTAATELKLDQVRRETQGKNGSDRTGASAQPKGSVTWLPGSGGDFRWTRIEPHV
jgi:hypothetical protein